MKNRILLLLLVAGIGVISFNVSDENPDRKHLNTITDNSAAVVDSKMMNANAISTWYKTNGSFNRDPMTSNSGFEWPKGSGKFARYASGIWLGCVSGNDTLTAVAEYSYDYLSGYVDNLGNPQSDSTYRIYVINKNVTNSYDYLHWPGNQGAYKTSEGKPFPLGDQTLFYVYTDGFPHASGSTSLRSLKAQILQTNWSYVPGENIFGYPSNPFNNTIFMEYRIINRSNETWSNMWVGLWTDDDLGSATDDKVGCDTNLHIGYTYNGTNNDPDYGIAPPAVGFKFIRGSYKYTGSLNDTIKYFSPFGSKNIFLKVGYRDEGMTAFNYYHSGAPEPSDPRYNIETYRVLKGLWRLGNRWVNPVTLDTTNKPYSGDPVTGTGWIMPASNDRRYLMSTGPYNEVSPGDTLIVIAAQIIAKGNSNLNSITHMRNTANTIQNFYDNNLAPQHIAPSPEISSYAPGNGKIYLTWTDTEETRSFKNVLTGGTYKFQGYNIYQIRTFTNSPVAGDTVLLKTFDIADGITNISDSIYVPPNPGIFYGIVQYGSDNGITRHFNIEKDTLGSGGFINGTEYKFAVTAYYYDPSGGLYTYPKVSESPKSNLKRIVPQSVTPGTQISYGVGDTIDTDQRDLAVMPVIIDPLKLISATYTSTFGGTNTNPNWTVTKTYKGITSILFENIYNFTGTQDSVRSADGLLFNHQNVKDSGLIRDPEDDYVMYYGFRNTFSRNRAWTYEPSGMEWFSAPDTNAIYRAIQFSARIIKRQFQSRSLGMSFATSNEFRNVSTRIKANGNYLTPISTASPILAGGPLRKIKIIFGETQRAYRFRSMTGNVLQTDSNLVNTPYAEMVDIPFRVFAADELDSSYGALRQLNVAFIDADDDGQWSPDTTGLSKFQFTYILSSNYDPVPNSEYTSKNMGMGGGLTGFSSTDIMYAWLPRVKNVNGVPLRWSNGDVLTVYPYRITRPDFVPGYPVKYSWEVKGSEIGNRQLASSEMNSIKVFPNPYYGFSNLDLNDEGERFVYVSHLPQVCNIYFYTLDGILIKKISRNVSDPNNTLEKWNLKNERGSYVASGMYLVYVDCNELGAKTLKIAIFAR